MIVKIGRKCIRWWLRGKRGGGGLDLRQYHLRQNREHFPWLPIQINFFQNFVFLFKKKFTLFFVCLRESGFFPLFFHFLIIFSFR